MTDTATIGHNSAIAAYSEFRAQLGELKRLNDTAQFDYEDPAGNKEARSHVYKLRKTKSAVEEVRKKEKAESLAYGRRVDEQAKDVIAEIEKMIEVHAKPLEEIEQREKDRVAQHEANLTEIIEGGNVSAQQWMTMPLESMIDRLAEIEAEPDGEGHWEEFAHRAAHAKAVAIEQLKTAIANRKKHDAEQAELERLRKENEARKTAEYEERIRKEAAEKAAAQAAREAETARVREKEAADRRELELKLAAERAEREKAEAEQRAANAEREAAARLEREARDRQAREQAELARREADKKHRAKINREAAAAFVAHGLTKDMAEKVVTMIAQKVIPNVSISY